MGRYLRVALSTGLVVGITVGCVDGIATLSRNVYLTADALRCLSAPILPATMGIVLLAGILALGFWWSDVTQRAAAVGATSILFSLAWGPIVMAAIAAGLAVRALVLRGDPMRVRRYLAWGAMAAAVLALASSLPALSMARLEGRHYVFDTTRDARPASSTSSGRRGHAPAHARPGLRRLRVRAAVPWVETPRQRRSARVRQVDPVQPADTKLSCHRLFTFQ